MKPILHPAMIEAAKLTRAGQLAEATRVIQRALSGAGTGGTLPEHHTVDPSPHLPLTIDVPARRTDDPASRASQDQSVGAFRDETRSGDTVEAARSPWSGRRLGKLADIVKSLHDGGGVAARQPSGPPTGSPEGARFLNAHFENDAGSREYRLYIPSVYQGKAVPLVVMLHGCTQSADDFAAGTRMNTIAEEHGFLVAYPAQAKAANPSKCWNWFKPADQRRGSGEPSLIAGITRQIARDYSVDQRRIYVAGLSAGGAAAAIVGAAYPDIYAAVGVHSGLPVGAASDLSSALAAMRQGSAGSAGRIGTHATFLPTIVFHGDSDGTVHPANGTHVIEQAKSMRPSGLRTVSEHGRTPGGRAYSRTCYLDTEDRAAMEMWLVHDAGHAWSGGSQSGSYTDPHGPDASREMVRFFFDHTLQGGIQRG